MSKAVRKATSAAFGIAFSLPVLAEDINTRPAGEIPQAQHSPIPQAQYSPSVTAHSDGSLRGHLHSSLAGSNEFGSPAGDMASDREVRLGANPGNIGVKHGETVKFVTADGREFRWRFDTLKPITSFPLASIMPGNPSGRVYVNGDRQSLLS
jgi:hypothetical protein